MKPAPLLLTNIGQLLTLRSVQTGPRRGPSLVDLDIIQNAAVLCLAGKIVSIGALVIGAIFFIRGSAGYSPRWRGRFSTQPFRTLDFYMYSPLCLALGVGYIALLTREMR